MQRNLFLKVAVSLIIVLLIIGNVILYVDNNRMEEQRDILIERIEKLQIQSIKDSGE